MLRRSSSTSSPSVVPLDQLAPGSWAEVVRVQGPLRWRRRLYALGFRPGTRVYVEQRAPLGDPIQYWVQDTWLALRRQTARQIWVRPVAPRRTPPENGTPLSEEV